MEQNAPSTPFFFLILSFKKRVLNRPNLYYVIQVKKEKKKLQKKLVN